MNILEAIKKVKETSKENFDATVEVHINLNTNVKKQDQQIRFSVVLPHGTGKTKKVAVMSDQKVKLADIELEETDIAKIEKGTLKPGRDFDIIISEPKFMLKIAKVAKILGPAGVMPSPKTGTVTDKVAEAVEQVKKGKIDIRTEQNLPVIHAIIGKISFDDKSLVENFNEISKNLQLNKPLKASPDWIKSIFVCSTMGKSVVVTS